MENLILKVIFGHFIGDFLFQSKNMAEKKYKPGNKGLFWCSMHVLVYTFFVSVFVGNFSIIFLIGVFVPHWIIDRWSLAYRWMILLGRGDLLKSTDPKEISFGSIIYVVIDQVIHFGCLIILLKLI